MKKLFKIFSILALTALLFSCADGLTESENKTSQFSRGTVDSTLSKVKDGYLRINTLSTTADNIWIWNDFDSEALSECVDWNTIPGGFPKTGKNGDFVYFDIKLIDAPQQVGFIIRKGSSKLSGESDIIFLFPGKYNEIYLKDGSGTIYINPECTKTPSGLASAVITGENKIKATVSGITLTTDNTKILKSDKKTEIKISSIMANVITVSESLKEAGTVYVQYEDALGMDERIANFDSSLIDEWFGNADVSTFGYKNGVFKTWAPFASDVKVLLFAEAKDVLSDSYKLAAEPIPMTRNADGTWQTENVSALIGSNKYYQYSFTNNGVRYDVCDIWAKVASKDSKASAIEEIPSNSYESGYKNPFGSDGTETKLYNDAVIYEMHITDWSQAYRSGVQKDKPGTFREITEALKNGGFADHLKDLGITHVQILPMFEYAVATKGTNSGTSVSFDKNDDAYNWGYNPYNYNTPESRYVQDMQDGTDAVSQMREMIAEFHKNGIAVIMDVVYNHTNGTGSGSIYDMTAPKYFYRMDAQGNYSNGSGCGNETATDHKIVKEFIINSLKHWMTDYHINGFRFDLMGIHEKTTMAEIYKALSAIDKNVMVYGEPWTGGTAAVKAGCTGAVASENYGVGAFDDDFRDAIKGAEFGGFNIGQIQSANSDSGIVKGLIGESGKNKRNTTDFTGLALHYAECHDNFTLYDKLVYSLNVEKTQANDSTGDVAKSWPASVSKEQIDLIKKQNKLAAAYIFLSQGTPFINGGQEFMRTKKGDPDSYAADIKGGVFWGEIDEVNAIDLSFKTKYADVYNTYRGLIALRTDYSAFRNPMKAEAETLSKGVTLYNVTADDGNFTVVFNASDKTASFDAITGNVVNITGKLKINGSHFGLGFNDVSSTVEKFSIAENASTVSNVPAKSFVILKK
ncbi:MAG: alpha-amylase family glycosyl hydrolase [Treponema sp.]|nr:alpha-amylase family glycosyl hydrolase [Treponema sp.]